MTLIIFEIPDDRRGLATEEIDASVGVGAETSLAIATSAATIWAAVATLFTSNNTTCQ